MANYETAFKLKVVKGFLSGDGGAKLLARRWAVPKEKIRTWVNHFLLHGIDCLRPKRSAYSAQFLSLKYVDAAPPVGQLSIGVDT